MAPSELAGGQRCQPPTHEPNVGRHSRSDRELSVAPRSPLLAIAPLTSSMILASGTPAITAMVTALTIRVSFLRSESSVISPRYAMPTARTTGAGWGRVE